MIKTKRTFCFISIFTALTCSCALSNLIYRDLGKVSFIKINPGESKPYSVLDLPSSSSPMTGSQIRVIQYPGLHFFHCDLSQTSISSTKVVMAVTIQNRMGSRFCNSIIGQTYNSIYYEIIKNYVETPWTSYITSQTSNATNYLTSSKTSGISALIEVPSNEASIAIDILAKFYEIIKNLNITTSIIDSAYSSSFKIGINESLMPLNSSSVSTDAASNILMLSVGRRNDITSKNGYDRKDLPGTSVGSCPLYNSIIVSQEKTGTYNQDYIHYIHQMNLDERYFLLFSSSKDISVKNELESLAISFVKKVYPNYINHFNIPVYGESLKAGLEYVYDQPNNIDAGALAGFISFGRISLQSIIASGLVAKITKNGTFSSIFSGSGIDENISIYGGKVQLSMSIPYRFISGTVSEAWRSYTSALSSRYATNSNNSDFTNNILIINELIKHFSPGSNNGPASFLTYGIFDIYYDLPIAYVYWMEIFYGSFNTLNELRDLNTKTNEEKIAAILNACKTLINSSYCSAAKTMCVRIE